MACNEDLIADGANVIPSTCADCGLGSCTKKKPAAETLAEAMARIISVGEPLTPQPSALDTQEGGTHYKYLTIQPIEYIHRNGIGFAEGCAIKYLTRWRAKGGIEDLKKARHFIDLLIELEGSTP